MHNYDIIFTNSFIASLALSWRSEIAWFAALGFGGYDMRLATLLALAGSLLGTSVDYVIGRIIAASRLRWFSASNESFARAVQYFQRYILLLLLFPWIPFSTLFAVIAGLFRISPAKILAVVLVGRICYYGYYLQ